jgi:hypothetical protein
MCTGRILACGVGKALLTNLAFDFTAWGITSVALTFLARKMLFPVVVVARNGL